MSKSSNIALSVIVAIVVIIAGWALLHKSSTYPSTSSTEAIVQPSGQVAYNPKTQGKVIFGITDAAASMGNVTSVIVTVNQIDVHSQTDGWLTVSTATKQYDLLALKASGITSLLAETNISAGTYDQIRLMISHVVVTQNGVQTEAKLPSGELKITGSIVVNADKTSTAIVDFMTDKSLHLAGNGEFIFTPVIKMEAQSQTDATVNGNDEVKINRGHVDVDADEGMDVNGEMKANFELDANAKIDEINNVLKVTPPDTQLNGEELNPESDFKLHL